MAIPAGDKCVFAASSWVQSGALMCDGSITVSFKDGASCWYPNTDKRYWDLFLVWPSKGKFVWRFLYKILPFRLIKNPCPPPGCNVTVPCCNTGLSTTLHATLTDNSGCGCVNVVIPLKYDAALFKWTGTANLGSGSCAHAVTLDLFCTSGGTGPNDFGLEVSFPDNCGFGTTFSPHAGTFQCEPLLLQFRFTFMAAQTCGCSAGGSFNIDITL